MTRTVIYSGTFDPITRGHEDVARRASQLFDDVVVAVARAHHKSTRFSLDERLSLARQALAHVASVRVVAFDGLLVDLCKKESACALIRGIRNGTDFDYETQLAAMNRKLLPTVETVFLLPDASLQCISSTLVREIAKLGGDVSSMVHPDVVCAFARHPNV
jgi:pantetheine-phosphate adenylyltransferase